MAVRIHVTGIVQGVGFRPWVWAQAERLGLTGWVRNSSSGVDIVADGEPAALDELVAALRSGGPPLARIDDIVAREDHAGSFERFEIVASHEEAGAYIPVSPDVATCPDCLREMRDPADRRYRYPFINCTNCGPRFTIIADIPYDRPRTTMAAFPLCPACEAEYRDPADRRFHAQPVACPVCGPRLRLEESGRRLAEGEDALQAARHRLASGGILAVKGLGGFHLACDASDPDAVAALRERKRREGKPFALMAAGLDTVRRHAEVSETAGGLLESAQSPVVLLPWKPGSTLAPDVAPGRDRIGFMLPYTPLHHLLLEPVPGFPEVLVMTSGNFSDEPIAYRDPDARQLEVIADAFLLHDRPIHMRCDDSVVVDFRGGPCFLRRSRGYAPEPVALPFGTEPVLAVGGELKNAFCVTRDDRAFMSHHIGELAYLETFQSLVSGLEHFERLFRVTPRIVAHDLHPDSQATRYARRRAETDGLPAVAVQHHHAHVASCMAEHGLDEPARVIGVALDGTGYGPDGAIWGGEFLLAGYADYERALHLEYCPLPGGDAATRNPYRTALSWMRQAGLEWDEDLPPVRAARDGELAVLERQLAHGMNTPLTSSAGRLFDAAASLAGVCHRVTYEAQAACEFEAAADPAETGAYPFGVGETGPDPGPALRELARDLRDGVAVPVLSARFHRGLAGAVVEVCQTLRDRAGLDRVALSGGVWQNMLLLRHAVDGLERAGFEVLVHRRVPANDGGLALGQAAVAAARSRRGGAA